MVRIKLITLGNLKYPVKFKFIEQWDSDFFKAEHLDEVQFIPNSEGPDWSYSDVQLAELIKPDKSFDFTMGITNAKLQDNYYLRRLGNNICVLSLYETAEIILNANLRIENFILRNLYEVTLVYLEGRNEIPESAYSIAHDETRCCLFDMNANKFDLVFSTENPKLCTSCRARIMSSQIPKGSLLVLERELKKIKKDLYYRVIDFIKLHPVYAFLISTSIAVLLNIFSNLIYDILRKYF